MKRASKVLQGRYECRAERHDDRGHDTKNVTITVVEETAVTFLQDSNMRMNETVIVEENEPYSLNCTVAGTPDPDVTWEKDGTPLTPDSPFFDGKTAALSDDHRRLELKYVFKDQHVGEYRCTARNRVNEVTGKLILTVPAAGLSTTAKVGLAVALLGIAILIITVVFLMRRVKTERRFRKSFRANELYLFEKGNIGQLNPDCSADEQAELLPYGQEWEVPRDQITLGKQLGSGAFGRVVKASVTGIEGPAATIVAIKTCKTQADASQVRALTLELKIMVHLGKHLNIVNLMGASTVHIGKGELWILVEYCRFGNLLVFMHRHRNNFINQIDPNTGRIDPSLLTADPNTLFSPLPPGVSSWRQTNSRGSHASFSQTPNTPIALSAPPPGHNAPLNHNNVHNPGTQQAHNPLYNAGIRGSMTGGGIVEAQNTNTTPPGAASSDATESCGSDGRTSDTTSSGQERGQQNAYYTSTMGSEGTQAPMSPAGMYSIQYVGCILIKRG
ncbi:Vascular endothelial growth factor receptor 2 [Chionoecetes opilio]|uniref:receptor protein-tyrosine kinase n=1 Tax=Chionoecetes opilio TaxID=41210 RepID=A0A8J5CSP6_CHIOP|nr:Vascular endothelial growth factor receptor 2 [Chionoecetes opilio]